MAERYWSQDLDGCYHSLFEGKLQLGVVYEGNDGFKAFDWTHPNAGNGALGPFETLIDAQAALEKVVDATVPAFLKVTDK